MATVPFIKFDSFTLPNVSRITDPAPGIKNVSIPGLRGDGQIIVPGGKQSQEIVVEGTLLGPDYFDLTSQMLSLEVGVPTTQGTLEIESRLTLTVRRVGEIEFPESDDRRTRSQTYVIVFQVISF